MRKLILIALLASQCFAIDGLTLFWTVKLTGDTVTVARLRYNNDSTIAWAAMAADTMNYRFLRVGSNSPTHDSTVQYMLIDSIRSNVDIDSIKNLRIVSGLNGVTILDTIVVDSIKAGNIEGGLVNCNNVYATGAQSVFNSISVDNDAFINGSINITGDGLNVGNNAQIDGHITVVGNSNLDSLHVTKGANASHFVDSNGNYSDADGWHAGSGNNFYYGGAPLVHNGTFACSLYAASTYITKTTAKYRVVDSVATVLIPAMTGNLLGQTTLYLKGLPEILRTRGENSIWVSVPLVDSASYRMAGVVELPGTLSANWYTVRKYDLSAFRTSPVIGNSGWDKGIMITYYTGGY